MHCHFLVGRDTFFENEIPNKLPIRARKMIQLVEDAVGYFIYPVLPNQVTSLDDVVVYIFEGSLANNATGFMRVS